MADSPAPQSEADLLPLFSPLGYVMEVRMQVDKGYAFVRYVTRKSPRPIGELQLAN